MDNVKLLHNQVAIVTGASGSLGGPIAFSLAQDGAAVILVYNSNKENANLITRNIHSFGGQAIAFKADVSQEDDIKQLVDTVINRFSKIDILINNAGINIDGLSWKIDKTDWQKTIDVNLTGTFLCTKCVLPIMRKTEYGRIINVSSIVSQKGFPGTSAYAASKSGLFGFTKSVAAEVAAKNITVNAIALGYFEEGMTNTIKPKILDTLIKQIPVKRFGRVNELYWVIRFLCAPLASYITGEILNVNGGLY